jgi:hypothetical protein
MKCRRCAGPMFPDEEGERFCLICGERTYDWLGGFLDRLLDAMERQTLKEVRGRYGKSRECATRAQSNAAVILSEAKDPRPRGTDSSSLRSSE